MCGSPLINQWMESEERGGIYTLRSLLLFLFFSKLRAFQILNPASLILTSPLSYIHLTSSLHFTSPSYYSFNTTSPSSLFKMSDSQSTPESLAAREAAVLAREQAADARHAALTERENAVTAREAALAPPAVPDAPEAATEESAPAAEPEVNAEEAAVEPEKVEEVCISHFLFVGFDGMCGNLRILISNLRTGLKGEEFEN